METFDIRTIRRPRTSVAHIAWTRNDVDRAELAVTRIRPELERAIARARSTSAGEFAVDYVPEVLRPGAAPEVVRALPFCSLAPSR